MEAIDYLTRQHREIEQAWREALGRRMEALELGLQARGTPRRSVHEQTDAAQPLR